jgi:hypothetical protein
MTVCFATTELTVHHGDCLQILPTLPPASVHAIVTDPPYNLSDSGKRDTGCLRRIIAEFSLPDHQQRDAERGKGCHLPAPALSSASLRGEDGTVRVDARIRVPEGPVDFKGAPVAEQEVNACGEPATLAPDGDLPSIGDAEAVKGNGCYVLKLADGGHAPFCDVTCSCFTEPGDGLIAVTVARRVLPEITIPARTWAAFLGLWMAEGHASITAQRGGESAHVAITHYNEANAAEMAEMLAPYFTVRRYPASGRLRINDRRLYEHLRQFGKAPDKWLPAWLKAQPPAVLRIFLDWYARGDGDDNGRIYTASGRLADDVQEIAMYAGWAADITERQPRERSGTTDGRPIAARHPQYVIRLLRGQTRPEIYDRRKRQGAAGRSVVPAAMWGGRMVYCVELERHHTLRAAQRQGCLVREHANVAPASVRHRGRGIRGPRQYPLDPRSGIPQIDERGKGDGQSRQRSVARNPGSREPQPWPVQVSCHTRPPRAT